MTRKKMDGYLDVKLTTVTVNCDKMRVGFELAREDTLPNAMDAMWTNAQVALLIEPNVGKRKDVDGQRSFGGPLEIIGDCGGFSVKADKYTWSVGGPAPNDDSERGMWTRLSGRSARLHFTRTGTADVVAEVPGQAPADDPSQLPLEPAAPATAKTKRGRKAAPVK